MLTSNQSIFIYASRRHQMDCSLAPLGKYCGSYARSNLGSPGSHSHATAVLGRCPGIVPHSNCHNSQLTPPIEVFLSILESTRHKLRIAHGLTLLHPSLHGWEAFLTPGAFTHTRITWAFSPLAPQFPSVILGSPLCPWCFGHSS